MTLNFDSRQRAMLQEMGIKVWLPKPSRSQAAVTVRVAPASPTISHVVSSPAKALMTLPVVNLPQTLRIANLPPDTITKYFDWIFVYEPGSADSDQLLHSMLRALHLLDDKHQILPHVLLAHTIHDAACTATSLQDDLLKLQSKRLVLLGPHASKAALRGLGSAAHTLPFLQQRGQVHTLAHHHCVVTYHPMQLLRHPHAKAQAWADLQLAARLPTTLVVTTPPVTALP